MYAESGCAMGGVSGEWECESMCTDISAGSRTVACAGTTAGVHPVHPHAQQ